MERPTKRNPRLVMVISSDPCNVPVKRRWDLTKLFQKAKGFILPFMNTSSAHGFSLMKAKERHPIEVFFRIVATAAAVFGIVKVSLTIMDRYQANPVITSIERNYRDWLTNFPALYICPTAKFSEEAIEQVLERYPKVKDRSAFARFFKELVNGSYLDWKDNLKTPFREVDPKEFWKIAFDISWELTYNVSSNRNDFYIPEMRIFMTEVGICYSYHSMSSLYSEKEYWEADNFTYVSNDLPLFVGNPLFGDIFTQVMNMNSGYKMFFLDPYEVPDVAMKCIEVPSYTYDTIDLRALSIVSDPMLKEQLTISQRKCRFPTESNLLTSPAYSYYKCRQECRMRLSMELCGCVAYFYRPTKGFPFCDYDGYLCLGQHGSLIHYLMNADGEKVGCDCVQLCSETKYDVAVENVMGWSLGTNLKYGLVKYPHIRYKRGVALRTSDLIVKIGGAAILFLGQSLLGLAEIVYLFTIGLVVFLHKNLYRV